MTICPKGFRTAAVAAGIKKPGTPDVGLIFSDTAAACAAVFTQNTFAAAPVLVCRRHLEKSNHRERALIVNSGNANAATGEEGLKAAEMCARAVASAIKCGIEEVLVASTGVIGRPLPADKICAAIPQLVSDLHAENADALARAIMTTDTFPKIAVAEFKGVRIVGVAKGAGMIHPDMATMLSFVMTDAAVDYSELEPALKRCAARSFNSITVDGDTSTNDMLAVLANGASGVRVSPAEFEERLLDVCRDLAKAIARDGEGASKFVELVVEGAPSEEAARIIGRAIARSPLVKTAIHGADPNWGRIVAAIGNSGVSLSSDRVDIYVGDIPFAGGNLEEARKRLSERDVQIRVVLHSGAGRAEIWTCDLTREYIAINADYTT